MEKVVLERERWRLRLHLVPPIPWSLTRGSCTWSRVPLYKKRIEIQGCLRKTINKCRYRSQIYGVNFLGRRSSYLGTRKRPALQTGNTLDSVE